MSTTTHRVVTASKAGGWTLVGSLMGISAGGVFLLFEMLVAGSAGSGAFEPLRMIGATVLGEDALPTQPTMGLLIAVPVALVVHFVLSAVYGTVAGNIGTLRGSRKTPITISREAFISFFLG